MKISVITVCYNAAKTIRETIESAIAQRAVEVEYLVVDGGSTDGTVDIIREAAQKYGFKYVSERDQGMYDALNKGIKMSTGEVIGILNADDRFEDELVLRDVSAAFTDGVDAVYGDIRFVRGKSDATTRYYSSRAWRPWMHNFGYMPAHPTIYARREVFDRLGTYKLGYEISADFEWMVRVLCRGKIRTRYLNRCMVTMRLGGKSTAGLKAMIKLNAENVRANRENGYFSLFIMMMPKYFYKILGYVFRRR